MKLYQASRDNAGVAVDCLLAALGHEASDSEEEAARRGAGALLILEAFAELRNIRRGLQG